MVRVYHFQGQRGIEQNQHFGYREVSAIIDPSLVFRLTIRAAALDPAPLTPVVLENVEYLVWCGDTDPMGVHPAIHVGRETSGRYFLLKYDIGGVLVALNRSLFIAAVPVYLRDTVRQMLDAVEGVG